jgi:hypothetical protein
MDVEQHSIVEFPVPQARGGVVKVRVLRFKKPTLLRKDNLIVMYVFSANGEFAAGRDEVRRAVGDHGARYAYWSKLEVTFGTADARPTEEVAVEAGKKFFRCIVPILMDDHWPDWDAVIGKTDSDEQQG